MRVLVAGGTGLIGWHAARELARRGHEVRVLARKAPPPDLLPKDVTFVQGDLMSGDLAEAFHGVAGVVGAAGTDYRVTPKGSAWEFYKRVNIDASVRLFTAARKAGVRRSVFITSYYHAAHPDLLKHPYIRSRADSEDAVIKACEGKGVPAIVQPPYVIGPIRGRPSLGKVLTRYVHAPILLAPPGGTNFMGATALGVAIANALDDGEPARRYLVGEENLTWKAFLERFAHISGHPKTAHAVPAATLSVVGSTISAWNRIAGREAGIPPRDLLGMLCRDLYHDATEAKRLLRYPNTLDQDIRACSQI
ncbi:MAG: NAD-dependent epimerase/dehydratase family protein [Nitrospirae bacterium]|nr:NAD-dependent epimerase/dehydratase family protein [Nitrospirota bacterium]